MKKLITGIALVLLVFIVYWIGSPYWTVYQVTRAIENNEPEKVSQYINFPSIQESLKRQIEKNISQELGLSDQNQHQVVLIKSLNRFISNQLVDVVVTPEMVTLLLQGKSLKESYSKKLSILDNSLSKKTQMTPNNTVNVNVQSNSEQKLSITQGRFHAWNKFVVSIPFNNDHKTQIILKPENGTWKIVDVYL